MIRFSTLALSLGLASLAAGCGMDCDFTSEAPATRTVIHPQAYRPAYASQRVVVKKVASSPRVVVQKKGVKKGVVLQDASPQQRGKAKILHEIKENKAERRAALRKARREARLSNT